MSKGNRVLAAVLTGFVVQFFARQLGAEAIAPFLIGIAAGVVVWLVTAPRAAVKG